MAVLGSVQGVRTLNIRKEVVLMSTMSATKNEEEEGGEGQGDKMRGGGSGNDRNEIVQELKPAKISQKNTMGG